MLLMLKVAIFTVGISGCNRGKRWTSCCSASLEIRSLVPAKEGETWLTTASAYGAITHTRPGRGESSVCVALKSGCNTKSGTLGVAPVRA
jgi:hypothetical protein